MEFNYQARIPKERIAVLLGVKGVTKKLIEKRLGIKIKVDSEDGIVDLQGDDSLNLVDDNNQLEIIDITTYTGDSKKKLIRIRARVIGEGGKTREYIEKLTDTNIVIYGKTVGIIGNYEVVGLVRRAFEGLLSGQRHSTVYTWLEKNVKERKQYI